MNKREKQKIIENLRHVSASSNVMIIAENVELNADQTVQLRKSIRKVAGQTTVAKNTLIEIGIKGTNYECLSNLLKGPTILMYSDGDSIELIKAVVSFAKSNQTFKIKGGILGTNFLNLNDCKTIAELPSLNELRSKIISIINAPATKLARLFCIPAEMLVRVHQSYVDKLNQ